MVFEIEDVAPLTGTRVLDLADGKASFCSKLLADMGAEVMKIETPGGDASRWTGPFWGGESHPEKSLSFWYNNTGKLSITLCLDSEEGQGIFLRLASKADVVIETFPPGYLRRIGLNYEVLSEKNPGLIFVSVTGFGQTGPYKDYKSCDIAASALGGQMYVCGLPNCTPLKPYEQQSYYAASLFAAAGVLITLRERNISGRGQHIDISLQEVVVATLEDVMVRYFYEKVATTRQGNIHWTNSACLLPCKDGYIFLTFGREWETLVDLLDSEIMAEDLKQEEWCNEDFRREHVEHIIQVLTRWTRIHTTAELFQLGQLMRFPWAPVSSPEDVFNSPQLRARNFFIPVDHPEHNASFMYPGAAARFSAMRWNIKRRAPLVGEHNAQVRGEKSGLSSKETGRFSPTKVSQAGYPMHKNALQGLRVLDFTWLLAGPYATRILADFGAEVIKVQSKKTATGIESNATGYFNTWNRNKLGITIDMAHPESKELILKLVKRSDVVIENFSPRVMANWGLNYEVLKEAKPDIMMVSMSGMGQTGPWRDFVTLGPTIQALSGVTYLTSYSQDLPVGIGYSYADVVAGLFAAVAVLAALEYKARTGRGQHIDISEYETMCSLLGVTLLDYAANCHLAMPQGNISEGLPAFPYGCYRCRGNDRWCVIAVFNEDEWQAMCQAMGNPPWAKQERFSTLSRRLEHQEELNELVEQWTSNYTPEEVMDMLQKVGVAAGKASNAADLANDPQLKSRDFFVHLHHPVLGKTISDGTPIRLSRTPSKYKRAAPLLGQDNQYVYRDLLELSKEQFHQYVEQGIIS
jgi:crotonobetainyl-CoA:carnitine CoA-transferase CaiB-like acyl-CoA transferase